MFLRGDWITFSKERICEIIKLTSEQVFSFCMMEQEYHKPSEKEQVTITLYFIPAALKRNSAFVRL